MQLGGQVRFDPVELASGDDRRDLQLTRAIARELGVLISDEQVSHPIDAVRRVVPVVRIALEHDLRALDPLAQHESSAGNHRSGARKGVGVLRKSRTVDRAGTVVRHQCREVRRRGHQIDGNGGVVGRRYAQRVRRLLTRNNVFRVDDDVDDFGVLRGRCGIDEAAEPGHEVGGNDPIAVGPARARAQREGVRLGVGADRPAPGDSGCRAGVLVEDRQAFAEIAENCLGFDGARFLRIESFRLGAITADENGAVRGGLPAARGQGKHQDESR